MRLLFLLWYTHAEPPYLTGLPSSNDTGPSFSEVFQSAGGEAQASPLVIWAVGKMAEFLPVGAGDETYWKEAAPRLLRRVEGFTPDFSPGAWAALGEAGRYLAHVSSE